MGEDYRPTRKAITGDEDEVSVGVGQWKVSLRGGLTIVGVMALLILGGLAYSLHILTDLERRMITQIEQRLSGLTRSVSEDSRMQTCVLALLPDERVQWRESRNPREFLVTVCRGLLLQSAGPDPSTYNRNR